ncbi:sedoheptulose-7-phosphate:D-glyceraldehyde-3- phosphate transaldolase [Dimargaris verticillata]|uniref:Transaldolase n=1 Tax=Dimargaris verticillata TaxID=2761393 RepID=A0A9W8B9V3_9FUNG|nr:sedoheptulose-7-phosphate:D-glyceraldehyde-3- phosphate transaldolase [Dimargaris verticillata]
MASFLEQLRQITTLVADTGDFEALAQFNPTDATTNPSLILDAAEKPQYAYLLDQAVAYAKVHADDHKAQSQLAFDKLLVSFGCEILKLVPGRVSVEVDARLSFNTEATIKRSLKLIQMFEEAGVHRDRVLIKIASTWEGIQAARVLENEHQVHCNMTILMGFPQAVACAEANATIISPYVGRIMDWHKAKTGRTYAATEDPGVLSVHRIYNYYKQHGYSTAVMGASFRNVGEIAQLAGCDYLTIGTALLTQLKTTQGELSQVLSLEKALAKPEPKVSLDESSFRWELNQDAMATEKLSEAIRKFAADSDCLESILARKLEA